jgi:hypothetical protein
MEGVGLVFQKSSPLVILALFILGIIFVIVLLTVKFPSASRSPLDNLPKVQTRLDAQLSIAGYPKIFSQKGSAPILPPNQSFLINICPLTGYLGGYLGPPEELMSAPIYLKTAFRAGIRSFVLPITTYLNHSKSPPVWPYSGEPVIACRDPNGILISVNGLTIDEFVAALIQYKSISGFGSEPIFLTLTDTVQEVDRKKIDYVSFMKKIARALAPLDPYRLTSVGSHGAVVGGVKQRELLTQIPLSTFTNKIIITTNFDVTQDPKLDLASYANFLYSDDTTLPVRTVAIEDLAGTTVNYVTNSRINLYMTTSQTPLVAPSAATVQQALTSGLQCIPIPFFSAPMETVSNIWSIWNGVSYILKPESARYTQPDPVVPSQVSTKLNASIQGRQPGNLVVNN